MQNILVLTDGTEVGAHVTARLRELQEAEPDLHAHLLIPVPKSIASIHGHQIDAQERAQQQLQEALELFERAGIAATGELGSHDPMAAAGEVIPMVAPGLILVSTLPMGLSRWLNMDLPHRLARRFGIPVDHLVGKAIDDNQWEAPSRPKEGPIQILLVEDSADEARLMRLALAETEERIDLIVVGDGAEAVNHIRVHGQKDIDLVLLDLKMPKVDGHEFLEIVGREFDVNALNVTVVTSSVSDEDRERAHALGAGAYVVKDPDIYEFQAAIHSIVTEVAHS